MLNNTIISDGRLMDISVILMAGELKRWVVVNGLVVLAACHECSFREADLTAGHHGFTLL